MKNELSFLEFLDRQHRADPFAVLQRQQIDDGLAARAAARLRQLVNLQPVQLAVIRKAQQRVVRIRDEQLIDEIFIFDSSRSLAAAAAALCLIRGNRLCLGVATMRQRHDHVFRSNEIFNGKIFVIGDDLGAACVGKGLADVLQLLADYIEKTLGPG